MQRRRPLQLAVEVLLGKSHVEHIPREYRIFCVPHLQKIRKGKPLFLQRTLERFRAAREEGAVQGASDAAVAAREHALHIGALGRFGDDADAPVGRQPLANRLHRILDPFFVRHRQPLEGRERLGDERIDAQGDLRMLLLRPDVLMQAHGHIDDGLDVLFLLVWQADHQVETELADARLQREIDRMAEMLLLDALVDDLPHAHAARLGSERDRAQPAL